MQSPGVDAFRVNLAKQRIRSVVRIRPVVEDDYLHGKCMHRMLDICTEVKADKKTVVVTKDAFFSKQFDFDYVFHPTTESNTVYETSCQDIVADTLIGYNGCCMLYGQTGRLVKFYDSSSLLLNLLPRIS